MARLSHSAITIYNECSYKFKLSYIDRFRPVQQKSSLLFGSSIDSALEYALKEHPFAEQDKVKALFIEKFTNTEINGVAVFAPTSDLIKYSKKDESWESLKFRGLMLIDTFFKDVYPMIERVYGVQVQINLTNSAGDIINGFADAVLKWKGYKQPIIFDFKTSGQDYPKNAVKMSEQLSLYKHALNDKYGTSTAGYIVFNKTLNPNMLKTCNVCKHTTTSTHKTCNNQINSKRCNGAFTITNAPSIDVQILIDDIDDAFEDTVLTRFDIVAQQMQHPIYEKNYKSCFGKYGKCQYFDYCKTGSLVDLIKLDKK